MKVCLMTEARLMQRSIFAVVASLALAGAASANETVVLNNWYIRDFAKNTCEAAQGWQKENRSLIARVGCENVTSCPEMSVTVEACRIEIRPPHPAARSHRPIYFETQFYNPGLKITKDAVCRRLYSLMSNQTFVEMFSAPTNCFDAAQCMREKKMALHVLAYNLTRVMNIVGVKPLMAAIRA